MVRMYRLKKDAGQKSQVLEAGCDASRQKCSFLRYFLSCANGQELGELYMTINTPTRPDP